MPLILIKKYVITIDRVQNAVILIKIIVYNDRSSPKYGCYNVKIKCQICYSFYLVVFLVVVVMIGAGVVRKVVDCASVTIVDLEMFFLIY